MRRVGDNLQRHLLAALSIESIHAHAQVVLHITAALVSWLQLRELREERVQWLSAHVRQHVQTAAAK